MNKILSLLEKIEEEIQQDLKKGSLQRKKPFNPETDVDEDTRQSGLAWSQDANKFSRDELPKVEGNARTRAMQKLHGLTQAKRHPETGERHFLMHRGMSPDEYTLNHQNNKSSYVKDTRTSWTPDYDMAKDFAENHHAGPVVSAWVPESEIHFPVNQILGKQNENSGENEYVINHTKEHQHANPNTIKGLTAPKPTNIDEKISSRDFHPIKDYKKDKLAASELNLLNLHKKDKYMKKLDLFKKNGLIDKIKSGAASLGMVAAMASTSPQVQADIPNVNITKPEQTIAHEDQDTRPKYSKNHILNAIKEVESAGGKNIKHKTVKKGLNKGMYSRSEYGLMPLTIKDTINGNGRLQKKYGNLLTLKGDKFHEEYRKHPNIEKELASRHYDQIAKNFGHDLHKIAYAWLNGISGTKKAVKNGKDIKNHWHVKKVKKAYDNLIN